MHFFKIAFLSIICYSSCFETHAFNVFASTQKKMIASQKHVVSIRRRGVVSAYDSAGSSSGTGFILSTKEGYVTTNAHVVGRVDVSTNFEIVFENGTITDAELVYIDPICDFAIVRGKDLGAFPKEDVSFSTKKLDIGQIVYMIGCNEGNDFSHSTGSISNTCEIQSLLPQQSIRISLNAQPGASGSAVFDEDGKIVALVYGSDRRSCAFAIPISYVLDAFKQITEKKLPKRQSIGIAIKYMPLDQLIKYAKFPKELAQKLRTTYPESFSRVLMVETVIEAFTKKGTIEEGDVILEVNGKSIGPNIYLFEKLINEADKEVSLTVVRLGKTLTIKAPVFDLQKLKITKMVSFCGGIFFEPNLEMVYRTGISKGVFLVNLRAGSGLADRLFFFRSDGNPRASIAIHNIDGTPISCLDDLIKIIPSLYKKEHFFIKYRNFEGRGGWDGTGIFNQYPQVTGISYNRNDGPAEVFEFDNKRGVFSSKLISDNYS